MPADPAPASTGTVSKPLPMKPSANSKLAKWPATGFTLDVRLVMRVKRLGGGDDDREHHDVGEEHSGEDVNPAGALLAARPGWASLL